MKRTVRNAWAFVVLAWAGPALADPACTYSEEEITSPAATQDSLTLLAVDPPEGAELRKDHVVSLDVQFQIADFRPDTYFVMAMFPTAGFSSMSPGNPRDTGMLKHAAGKVHLCVSLEEVYEHPAMLWPLSLSVGMLKATDERGSSSMVASTPKVKFKSPDAPLATKQLPDEYYDALQHTSSFFDNRVTLYKLCIARYPPMQPALTKAYRAWEARHRADIELVTELQFERFKEMAKGRVDHATAIADGAANASRQFYAGLKPAALKQECDSKLAEFVDPDDNTDLVIGDEMVVLRKHSGRGASK